MKSITFILTFIVSIASMMIGYHIAINQHKTITLQKSSDSEWEVSPVSMPDTTITDTVRIGDIEVHPTIQYLNVKL